MGNEISAWVHRLASPISDRCSVKQDCRLTEVTNFLGVVTGKWKGVTVAVKIVEHNAETESELVQLRESLLSSSVVHPNVVRPPCSV